MGNWCWRVGSLSRKRNQEHRHKVFRCNALRYRISGRFFGDNPVVGWVRYGLNCVREADANADCGLMCRGRQGGSGDGEWHSSVASGVGID